MLKLGLFFYLICSSLFALTVNIDIKLNENSFKIHYQFSELVNRFVFTSNPDAFLLYKNLNEDEESILVKGDEITLETHPFKDILFTSDMTKFFLLNDQTFMIYSYALDLIKVELENGEQEIVDQVHYYHNEKLIHVRDIQDKTSFEKYLIVEGKSAISKIEQDLATFYVDTDLPHRKFHIGKIQKAIDYLYEKFGPPIAKPTIFFSYNPGQEKDIFIEGRNLIYDDVIMLSAGSLEDVSLDAENFRLYFYNLLYAHEIIHHWTSKNLDSHAHGWVHEGAAEAISHIMVKEVFAEEVGDMGNYMKEYNYNHCQMRTAVFDFSYHCGAVIWDLVFQNITSDSDPFKIMKEVMELPEQSEEAVSEIFSMHTSSDVMETIVQIVNSKYQR